MSGPSGRSGPSGPERDIRPQWPHWMDSHFDSCAGNHARIASPLDPLLSARHLDENTSFQSATLLKTSKITLSFSLSHLEIVLVLVVVVLLASQSYVSVSFQSQDKHLPKVPHEGLQQKSSEEKVPFQGHERPQSK